MSSRTAVFDRPSAVDMSAIVNTTAGLNYALLIAFIAYTFDFLGEPLKNLD